MDKVAFVGLGIMGGWMAANLAAGGVTVSGWNRTPNKPGVEVAVSAGASICKSPQDAVADASIVFFCLGDENDIDEILFGGCYLAGSMALDTIVVDMSTSGPNCAKTLSQKLSELGLRFLDAPVSGGDIGAKQGSLTIMVGGQRSDFDHVLPFFELMGKNIVYCGAAGSGQSVKLCNQVLCAVNMMAVCEAVQLAQSLNVDPALVVEVCSTGAGGSWALSNLGPKIVKRDFQPGFRTQHMLKDLRLAQSSSRAADKFPAVELALRNFELSCKESGDSSGASGTQAMILAYSSETPE